MLNASRNVPQNKIGRNASFLNNNTSFVDKGQQEKQKKEENEEITRVLSTINPNAPANTMRYSYKTRDFRNDPSYGQTHIHFTYDGNFQFIDEQNYNPQEEDGDKMLYNQFNFSTRGTQTFNIAPKSTMVETVHTNVQEFSGEFSRSIIYDKYKEKQDNEKKHNNTHQHAHQSAQNTEQKPAGHNLRFQNKEGLIEKEAEATYSEDGKEETKPSALVSLTPDQVVQIKKSLELAERLVTEKNCNEIVTDFALWEDPADEFRKEQGSLFPLWDFVPEFARQVSSITWHPKYKDIFAVGYGEFGINQTINRKSQINIYSLKNIFYPEKILETPCDVTSIEWNPIDENMLLCGLIDGNVMIWDVSQEKIICESNTQTGKHLGLVSELAWIKDYDKAALEANQQLFQFISVSYDGQIIEWIYQSGLLRIGQRNTIYDTATSNDIGHVQDEKYELTNFQKQLEDAIKNTKSQLANEATILIDYRRDAAQSQVNQANPLVGLSSLEFNPSENQNWLFAFGCDNGLVRLTSTSYTNDYIQTFTPQNNGHQSVVHDLCWNYFKNDLLAAASEDNFVKIFQVKKSKPIHSYDLESPVIACQFSNTVSTVLIAGTASNNVHVFDLNVNKEKELCIQKVVPDTSRLSTLALNQFYPILAVGDSTGIVRIFKLSPNLRNKSKYQAPKNKQKGEQQQQLTQEEITKIEYDIEVEKIEDYVTWCRKAAIANGEE